MAQTETLSEPKRETPLSAGARICLPLGMALAIVATCGVVAALARATPILANHVERELERERELNGLYLYDGGYIDDADYVLIEQVPHDDHSRGGVYFFGDSQGNAAIRTWELPPEERALIHNYSIGDMRYRDVRNFVELLVEEFDLLQAGGEKNTFFLGLSYYMTRPIDYDAGGYVKFAFLRHEMYNYDADGHIHREEMTDAEWWMRSLRNDAERVLPVAFGLSRSRVKAFAPHEQTPEFLRLADNWRTSMDSEIADLASLINYLQERNVNLRGIMRPSGSWEELNPYEGAHNEAVRALFAAHGIPIIDQSDSMPDSAMVDNTHVNYQARMILHRSDREMALQALRDMNIELRQP